MVAGKNRMLWLLLLVFMGLTGCEALPVLDHPFRDSATAQLDQELIGYWKQVNFEDNTETPPEPFVIGVHQDHERLHEAVHTGLGKDGKVTIHRIQIPTARLSVEGSRVPLRLVTMAARDLQQENKGDEVKGYLLLRYEVQAGQRMKLFLMNPDAIVQAIESGRLPGMVRRTKPRADGKPSQQKYAEIRITGSPAQVQSFLEKTGSSCFEKKQCIEFQKILRE